MSGQELKKYVQNFNDEMSKGKVKKDGTVEPAGRLAAQDQEGQFFILPKETLYKSIDLMTESLNISKMPGQAKGALMKKLRTWFAAETVRLTSGNTFENSHLVKQNFTATKTALRLAGQLPQGAICAVIRNYNQVSEWKKGGSHLKPGGPADIVAQALLKHEARQKNRAEDTSKEARSEMASHWSGTFAGEGLANLKTSKLQTGHGEFGRAATQYHVGRATEKAWEGVDKSQISIAEREYINNVMITMDNTLKSTFSHEMLIDSNGEFKKEYMVVNSWQLGELNQKEADREGVARAAAVNTMNAMPIDMSKASISLRDAIEKVLLFAMTNKTKRSGAKVRITGAKPVHRISEKSKAKDTKKFKSKHRVGIIKTSPFDVAAVVKSVSKRAKKEKSRGPEMNLAIMLTILNKKINKTVQQNMGDPSLINRTGRFATSVRVNSILPGAVPVAQYTYDRFRYGRFEGTEPWADGGNRDPKKLIERSIREITIEHAMGRFLTQRV